MTRDSYLRPLFVIGDSHSGPLNGFVVRGPGDGEAVAFGESWCVQGLSAATALDEAGELHPGIVAALAGFHMLRSLPPDYAGDEPTVRFAGRSFAASWIAHTTPLLMVAGELDVREIIAAIPRDTEPMLPFHADLSRLAGGTSTRALPANTLQERIVAQLRPLFTALNAVRALGIERLALASLPPPTSDDDEYFRITGIRCSERTRYAVHMFANRLLRTFCAQSGVAFVDTWDDMTENNVAKPGLLIDGLHVGALGAGAILRALHGMAVARERAS